jgi:sterol desaturase/sphingolipid hydroxylase (fatty acid hydroxylase superfamily)
MSSNALALLGFDPRQPWAAFTRSSELVYLPYLLPAVAIMLIARYRTAAAARVTRTPSITRSLRNDAAMFVLNGAFLFHLIAAAVFAAPVALWTRDRLRPIVGSHELLQGVPAQIVITIVLTLAIDFSFFAAHVLQHRIPLLWCFHKVHHSAPAMTPLTAYRSHPVDDLVEGVIVSIILGVFDGTLLLVFDPDAALLTIAGTNAVFTVGLALLANLRHSHTWVTWGDRLEHVVCSPAQHQIHHSTDARHHDRNFGGLLSLWDWLFGTLVTAGTRQSITFGLGAESERYHTVRDMYLAPVREAADRWVFPHWRRPDIDAQLRPVEPLREDEAPPKPTDALVQA